MRCVIASVHATSGESETVRRIRADTPPFSVNGQVGSVDAVAPGVIHQTFCRQHPENYTQTNSNPPVSVLPMGGPLAAATILLYGKQTRSSQLEHIPHPHMVCYRLPLLLHTAYLSYRPSSGHLLSTGRLASCWCRWTTKYGFPAHRNAIHVPAE
jgi:hypothetical protein